MFDSFHVLLPKSSAGLLTMQNFVDCCRERLAVVDEKKVSVVQTADKWGSGESKITTKIAPWSSR